MSAEELVYYTNPQSRGRIARWMLEECEAPYRAEVVAYGPTMKSEPYRSINPMGKVPALVHGDLIVTEVAAICAYLADAFPEKKLAPPVDSRARGSYYRWLFFAAGPLEQAIVNQSLGFETPADKQGRTGYGNLAVVLDTLEALLKEREFVAGESFTAADLYLASHLMFGHQFGTIDKRDAFVRYAEAHGKRPAALRARELDDALMKT